MKSLMKSNYTVLRSNRNHQQGGTMLGLIIGLLVGLAIAVIVAIYINHAPTPFKVQKPGETSVASAPVIPTEDPNKVLQSKVPVVPVVTEASRVEAEAAAAAKAEAAAKAAEEARLAALTPEERKAIEDAKLAEKKAAAKKAAEKKAAAKKAADELKAAQEQKANESESDAHPTPVPVPQTSVTTKPAADPIGDFAKKPAATTQNVGYLLQVGAFKSKEDADRQKARLAITGLESQITQREVNGVVMYRVRTGPYNSLEDMNRAHDKLRGAGIEAAVVRFNKK